MYIRFVILLLSIFMIFMPCYGMQVATNHEALVVTSKVAAKVYKVLKVKNNDIVLSIFWLVIGLAFLINAILKKKNKKKIWGTVLIVLGIVALLYAMGFALMWLIVGTYSTQQASGFLLVLAAFLGVGSIISLFFGDRLLRKGRKEEQEKLQKNNN
jgi:hypothetical protein